MKNLVLLLLCLFAVACNSCTPQPSPLPPPAPSPSPPVVVADAGTAMGGASPVDPGPEPVVDPGVRLACDNLSALHCAEGMAGCYAVLQKVVAERLTSVPLACLVAAHSKADVHACGKFVACP